MNLYESLKNSLKESGSILDPVFTVCYNRLSIFPTRKSAIDFYKECMYGSEGSERERYTNIYLDLLDGSDVGLDDIDGDDTVWEIRWEDETGRNVAAQKLDGHKSANEIIKKIKSGKIMPPKEFLDVIDADTPKIEEGQKLKEAERKEESSWSSDGKSLNLREMVARALENNLHGEDEKYINDDDIDNIYAMVADEDQYMEEIYMEIENQALEAFKRYKGGE